jgi:hypothetical protein
MEWKQIETKWLAMTRRIRAGYPADRKASDLGSVSNKIGGRDLPAIVVETMTVTAKTAETKSSAK